VSGSTERAIDLKPHGWSADDPFVVLTFRVFDGSAYPVAFERVVDGDSGNLVQSQPRLTEGAGGHWRRGHVAPLRLQLNTEQWSSLSEVATEGTLTDEINTGGAYLMVSGEFPDSLPLRFMPRAD
jgi:hypothetical protein